MRRKRSLSLEETTIAAVRAGAEQDGKPLSQRVEKAILNEVGRAEADRLPDLDRRSGARSTSTRWTGDVPGSWSGRATRDEHHHPTHGHM
jgi:hypothetical protein